MMAITESVHTTSRLTGKCSTMVGSDVTFVRLQKPPLIVDKLSRHSISMGLVYGILVGSWADLDT